MATREVVHRTVQVTDPPLERFLFSDTRMAWLWLIIRIWLGYNWLSSGYGKLTNPAWTVTGDALKGFWSSAVQTQPKTIVVYDWYRQFLQYMLSIQAYTWFSKLVVAGELIVGILLVLGAFTGIAAFIGGFMNWNFMMAGSASTNPVFFVVSVLLILAWKTAGYYGLDRWLLPMLGTPWKPAFIVRERRPGSAPSMAD